MLLAGAIINTNSECQVNLGTCDEQCITRCKQAHADGHVACYDGVTCTCHYGCIDSTCRMIIGQCNSTCDFGCCQNQCLHALPGSDPVCELPAGLDITFCNCEYPC